MTLHADSMRPWFIMYGKDLSVNDLKGVTMAVVEPDYISPAAYPQSKTRFYGYVSIGAMDQSRAYWKTMKGTSAVVEADLDWPESYRMDIRSKPWQRILLHHVIPEIAKHGFAGVFLDTIDTPLYFESRDPKKFAGSGDATIHFITTLKKTFPKLGILTNNAFPILDQVGALIDGAVAEDVYTRYNFTTKTYEATPAADTQIKATALDQFIQKFKKPVYVVLYGDPKSKLIQEAIAHCKEKGYQWYVATVDLNAVGTIEQ